jgi:site-specific DNA-methyltransferase (adenine-specific)
MKSMYQIQQGDCLELMGNIPDKSIDMIFADLPYGTTACSWDTIIPFEPLWDNYKRIIKSNGCIALFGTQPFTTKLISSNFNLFKQELIWDKMNGGNFVNANKRVLPQHENILIFYDKPPTYNPILKDKEKTKIRPNPTMKSSTITTTIPVSSGVIKCSESRDGNKSFPTSIFSYSKRMAECNESNRVHPTQKPVALLENLILLYTNENETVLDNTMGSGSTGVACIRTNRNFIGFEKDSNYFQIAEKRILEEIDKTSLFNSLGGRELQLSA